MERTAEARGGQKEYRVPTETERAIRESQNRDGAVQEIQLLAAVVTIEELSDDTTAVHSDR